MTTLAYARPLCLAQAEYNTRMSVRDILNCVSKEKKKSELAFAPTRTLNVNSYPARRFHACRLKT